MLTKTFKVILNTVFIILLNDVPLFAQDISESSCITMKDLPQDLLVQAGTPISATVSFFLTAETLHKYEDQWMETFGKNKFKRKVSLVYLMEDTLAMGNTSVPYENEQSYSQMEVEVKEFQVGWNKIEVEAKLSPYMKGNYRASAYIGAEPLDPTKGFTFRGITTHFLPALNGCSRDISFKVVNQGVFDLFGPSRYQAFIPRPAIENPKESYVIGDVIPLNFYGFDTVSGVCSQESKGQGSCKDGFAKITLISKNKDSEIKGYEVSLPLFKSEIDYGYKKLYEVYKMNLPITKRMPEGENFIALRIYDLAGNNHTIQPYGKIRVMLK